MNLLSDAKGRSGPSFALLPLLPVVLWNLAVAVYSARLSLTVFGMETLTILGRSANLGRPVQLFAALVVLVPAVLALLGSAGLLARKNWGRYLLLAVNFAGAALSLFALLGVWGVYGSFERIVDGVMANAPVLLGFAAAYALYWLAGRLGGRAGEGLERAGLILAGLTLIAFLLLSNVLGGVNYVLSTYAEPRAWLITALVLAFGAVTLYLLRLGAAFGETPDQRNAWQGWFMLSPNILGFLFFFAGPLLLSFYLSFTDSSVGQVPNVIGLRNYADLLAVHLVTVDDPGVRAQNALPFGYAVVKEFSFGDTRLVFGAKDRLFWLSLWNTLLFCLLLLPLAILPALGMALVLNSSLPGVGFFRALYFLPSVAAVVGTALIWRWLYSPTVGYINYTIATVAGWFGLPDPEIEWLSDPNVVLISMVLLSAWTVVGYNIVLFLAGLQGIPKALYEAAKIDGANGWQRFRNVTLPMLAPTTFFVLITTMITGLQVFNEPYALFPSIPIPENATTLVYYLYQQGFTRFNFGYASSIAWVLFLIIFGFTFLQFRLNRSSAYE